jgi:hypothetical protein
MLASSIGLLAAAQNSGMLASSIGLLAAAQNSGRHRYTDPATMTLIDAVQRAPNGSRIAIVEVGSNSGLWLKAVLAVLADYGANKRVDLVFFEPQARFAPQLEAMAQRWLHMPGWSVQFVPAAAWTSSGSMAFITTRNTEAATLAMAGPAGRNVVTVPTYDLAPLLKTTFDGADVTFLKLE